MLRGELLGRRSHGRLPRAVNRLEDSSRRAGARLSAQAYSAAASAATGFVTVTLPPAFSTALMAAADAP